MDVRVLCPSKPLAQQKSNKVIVPGVGGYITVLPGHAPLVSELDIGLLSVTKLDGATLEYFVAGGYIEVTDSQVTLLADVIESRSDIDNLRATEAKDRALKRLASLSDQTDITRATAALRRAETRLVFVGDQVLH